MSTPIEQDLQRADAHPIVANPRRPILTLPIWTMRQLIELFDRSLERERNRLHHPAAIDAHAQLARFGEVAKAIDSGKFCSPFGYAGDALLII